ncbi:MAG: transporter substrate-binding domain-containing protein [Sulfurimonas sp.]|nr:transporter substrate-binding domain-containing protein [Sulfurimonas sp.]MBU3939083.1 ABC transporter substrate-binding protein [bacterium]MBU4025595.1 ABC transporter substrate-binding protein [bacterium]MBU4058048.1 ABC transporter substrate-binding protein [bacterium]
MRVLFLLFFLGVTLYGGHPDVQKRLEKVSLQLHWKYQFQFAGFIAAKEKGFYEEVGLDVELKEYQFATDIVQEVLSKRANYGIYNSNILVSYLHNKDIKLLSSYFKRSALVLIVQPEINFPSDLIDKKIMAAGKEDFLLNFKSLLSEYNLALNELHLVEHSYGIDEFVDGKVDAMTAFISDQPHKLDKLGVKYNIINPSDIGLFNLQLELFTSKEEAINHSLRAMAFRDASIKGWKYALNHKAEMIEIIYKKYSKNISKDDLLAEAKEIERLILPKTYDIGSIDENFLHRQFEDFKINYKIKEDKNFNDFIFKDIKDNQPNFSKEELEYINKNKEIKVCLQPDLYPLDGYFDAIHTGIMGDIYTEISKKTGIKFIPLVSKRYDGMKQKIVDEECSIVSICQEPKNDLKNLVLSKPFLKTHFTILSRLDKPFIDDSHRLEGKKLVVRFAFHKEMILKRYPYLQIEVEENIYSLMQKLLKDEVFGVVTINEISDYLVDKYGYGKLKVNGFLLKDKFDYGSIGVQKNEPLLFSILQKSLDSISEEKKESIVDGWKMTRYHDGTDYSLAARIVVGMGILFLIMAYYQKKLYNFNAKLEYQVEEKTQELRELNESLEKTVQEKINELIKKDLLLTNQSKQAVMGEMISMIAHQWRQPLSAITLQISNIQLESMLGKKVDEAKKEQVLSDISEKIMYLSQTIDDFQTFFRPDRIASEVEAGQLFKRALKLGSAKAEHTGINIAIIQNEKIVLLVYENELVQVILNLLNNAIDAFKDLDKKEKTIELFAEEDKDSVLLFVKDNASGITEENMKKIFEPYFSTKGKNGTGLGLYMSQMIIQKQFNGEIDVQTSNEGTTFIIKIPKHFQE